MSVKRSRPCQFFTKPPVATVVNVQQLGKFQQITMLRFRWQQLHIIATNCLIVLVRWRPYIPHLLRGPWVHSSSGLPSKRHLNRFSHFCAAHVMTNIHKDRHTNRQTMLSRHLQQQPHLRSDYNVG